MAALNSQADAWDVEPLREELLSELDASEMDDEHAALLVGATFAQARGAFDPSLGVVRLLAAVAPLLEYPSGLIGDCYIVEEFLDRDCHPDGKQDADRLERKLRTDLALDLNPGLASALVDAT